MTKTLNNFIISFKLSLIKNKLVFFLPITLLNRQILKILRFEGYIFNFYEDKKKNLFIVNNKI